MAFTGTPVVKLVSERKVRITGLSLVALASGTISLHAGAGAVKLPSQFIPEDYAIDTGDVDLVDSVECRWNHAAHLFVQSATGIKCVKTGTVPGDLLLTLTNANSEGDSPELEIWVTFH